MQAISRLPLLAFALVGLTACGSEGRVADDASVDGGTGTEDRARDVPAGVQAISFLGDTLRAPDQPAAVRESHLENYTEAEDALAEDPDDVDALVWMGRRTAYLGQYREAIDIFTHALTLHPNDARLYRHRGHRYLTVREPARAVADFERAVELIRGTADQVEPDGLPNERNIPTSTLHFNIWYHLGLAHYVMGDFEAAEQAYRECLAVSVHPDSVVATSYWLYLTLRRLGQDAEAAAVLDGIQEDMDIIESTAYLDLLLLFKGERDLEDLTGPAGADATLQSTTTAYGLGAWHRVEGREDEALATFRRIMEGRDQWAAFGYMAAEAELARMTGEGM
ncbi:MAG: tetratricopeptide repeat protein [Gemmatimonadota bacterium]